MADLWKIFSAISSRLIFVGHGMYSLYTMINRIAIRNDEDTTNLYWILTILFAFFFVEGAYTIVVRKGNEYKYFWPSGFIYLTIMIPITWVLETFLLNEELNCVSTIQKDTGNTTNSLALTKFCNIETTTGEKDQKIRSAIEIGMLGALVFGRWLLPRGDLTRDQLSALLLAFIGNGADVIEFLNTGNDFPSLRTGTVMYTVLAVYSFSLLQFAVVTTKTTLEYIEDDDPTNSTSKKKENSDPLPKYLQKLLKKKVPSTKNLSKLMNKNSNLSSNPTIQKTNFIEPLTNRTRAATVAANTFTKTKTYKYGDAKHKPRAMTTIDAIMEGDEPNNNTKSNHLQKQRGEYAATSEYLKRLAGNDNWQEISEVINRGRARGFTTLSAYPENGDFPDDDDDDESEHLSWFGKFISKFDQEVFQVLISMFTLEMPYLISRIVFSAVYKISSVTMVFYTMKNLIMTLFLIYRLWVILTEDEEKEADETKFRVDAMNLK